MAKFTTSTYENPSPHLSMLRMLHRFTKWPQIIANCITIDSNCLNPTKQNLSGRNLIRYWWQILRGFTKQDHRIIDCMTINWNCTNQAIGSGCSCLSANNKQPYHVKKLQSFKTEPHYQTWLTTSPPWPPLPHLYCGIFASSRFDSLTHQSNPSKRSSVHAKSWPNLTKNGGPARCGMTTIDLQSFVGVSGPWEYAIKQSKWFFCRSKMNRMH